MNDDQNQEEIDRRSPTPEISGQGVAVGQEPTPTTGRRQAFRDLRRQLTDEDLGSAGVQKLLLDELERAESQCVVAITTC
jgi:hypothetical protein